MTRWAVMNQALARSFVPFMEEMGVSEVARSRRGFFHAWNEHKSSVWSHRDPKYDQLWSERRDNFVSRHMQQFRANPTLRRFLALVAWAYTPLSESKTRSILVALADKNHSRARLLVG
jgi:hypothetical protein